MSSDDPSIPLEAREIPLVWVGAEDLRLVWANQFLLQVHGEEVFLSAGQATPPALIGSLADKVTQLDEIDFVPVHTLTRLALSPGKLRELHALLDGAVKALDERKP